MPSSTARFSAGQLAGVARNTVHSIEAAAWRRRQPCNGWWWHYRPMCSLHRRRRP